MDSGLLSALFDLDGTLIDSVELILRSYEHTLAVHRGVAPPREFFLAGLGVPLREQFRSFTEDESEIDSMVTTYREHNHGLHDDLVRPFAGAVEALRTLRERGIRIAVVTNKLASSARMGLRVCGFEDLVETVVGAGDVAEHKPSPQPVRAALRALGVGSERSIFFGDSPIDMQAGRAAGVRTAAVLWGPFPRHLLEREQPDHFLDHPGEITGLLPAP